MIFESTYRRQAMDKLKNENKVVKNDLKESWENKHALSKNPFVYAIASIFIWFSQH